ncbi:hypothetical protein [Longimicrobium terrae]|uniref:Uncharacterized protein n=1 Tax=Longimicrobium terrae TaxID=1639882 RepID=A0A841GZS6_9BACT|nr:hypothetical protein [Longimicrobium terrae]MBB4637077.1 hypothetical protein [Longimicrobium terrae]MBB6071315.1 hypothetical protein [Longimicrobium terrae]NNC31466.1 hypothetical protein [Longimicrobium terrae]
MKTRLIRSHGLGTAVLRFATLCVLALAPVPAHAQEVLTNEHIVELTRASVDPAVIVSTIESSRSSFNVGVREIVALSDARVNREVIAAMHAAVSRSGQPRSGMGAGATASVPLPSEFGMFVVRGGEPSRLPLVAMTLDNTWTDGRGQPMPRIQVPNGRAIQAMEVEDDNPTLVLFRETSRPTRVRMFHLTDGVLNGALLRTEIPLQAGPAGTDPRMLKLTPGIALTHGSYLIVLDEDFTRAYGFGRVQGRRNVPSLEPSRALALVQATAGLRTTLSPDSVRSLVLDVLAREHIPVERDFDAAGLLLSLRGIRGGGWLSDPVAVQFAIRVQPSGSGSEIRVAADAYMSGSPSGWLTGADLAEAPLVSAPDQSRRHAQGIKKDIERAIQRATQRTR